MEHDYEHAKTLHKVLAEFEHTATKPNPHAFILLCRKHSLCPSCGQKATKFSKTNYHCDKCKGKISALKSKLKSIMAAYVQHWSCDQAHKFIFHKIFKQVERLEKTRNNKDLSLLSSLSAIYYQIEHCKEHTKLNGEDYPQEKIDSLWQDVHKIYKGYGIKSPLEKEKKTKKVEKQEGITKLLSFLSDKSIYGIQPEKVIKEMLQHKLCVSCGVELPTNGWAVACKACQNKLRQFKHKNRNVIDNMDLYIKYHARTEESMTKFIKVAKKFSNGTNSNEIKKKEIEKEADYLRSVIIKDLEKRLRDALAQEQALFREWERLDQEKFTLRIDSKIEKSTFELSKLPTN